ncbi:hypothetical protein CJ030_MR3G009503 [Morella rubra]|uniref:RNase H type-1 domain-containing protein n=1 Tax=Morella rubra TaxID=262757 RepID=A0A6A1W3R2_9ROSI|nr:hypothetical protein CJ030_MR3G009503 [Morella rubra]
MELEGLRITGKHPWGIVDLDTEEAEYLLSAPAHSFSIDTGNGCSSSINTTIGFESSMSNQSFEPLDGGPLKCLDKKLSSPESISWKAPPLESTKINVDVVVRDDFVMVAVVIRDNKGACLGMSVRKLEAMSPLEGELNALKLGFEEVSNRGIHSFILESDSENAVKAVKNHPKRTEWEFHHTVEEIHAQLRQLHDWEIQHVYHSANPVVHNLARWTASIFSNGSHPIIPEILKI